MPTSMTLPPAIVELRDGELLEIEPPPKVPTRIEPGERRVWRTDMWTTENQRVTVEHTEAYPFPRTGGPKVPKRTDVRSEDEVDRLGLSDGYRKLLKKLRVSFADSSAMDPFIRQKAMNEAADVIELLERRVRRFKSLSQAQREMIAWYEDDHEIYQYDDEDLPREVLEYRQALAAIEERWAQESER